MRSTGCVGAMLAADKLLLQSRIRQVCRSRLRSPRSLCLPCRRRKLASIVCRFVCESTRTESTSRVPITVTRRKILAKPTAAGRTFSVQKKKSFGLALVVRHCLSTHLLPHNSQISLSWAMHMPRMPRNQATQHFRDMACVVCCAGQPCKQTRSGARELLCPPPASKWGGSLWVSHHRLLFAKHDLSLTCGECVGWKAQIVGH